MRSTILLILALAAVLSIGAFWRTRPRGQRPEQRANTPVAPPSRSPTDVNRAVPTPPDPSSSRPVEEDTGTPKASPGPPGRPALPVEWARKVHDLVDTLFRIDDPEQRFEARGTRMVRFRSANPSGDPRLDMDILAAIDYEYYFRETDPTNRAAMLAMFGKSHDGRFAEDALPIFAAAPATPAGQNAARYLYRIEYPGFSEKVLMPTIDALLTSANADEKMDAILGLEEFQVRFPQAQQALETALLTDPSPGVPELALEALSLGAPDSAAEMLGRAAISGRTPQLRRTAVDLCVNTVGRMTPERRELLLRISREAPDGDVRERAAHVLEVISKAEKGQQPHDVVTPK